jgi:hypothetical protein
VGGKVTIVDLSFVPWHSIIPVRSFSFPDALDRRFSGFISSKLY